MDLENQKRVKGFAEQYGPENVVVLLGAAEGEAPVWLLRPSPMVTPLMQVR